MCFKIHALLYSYWMNNLKRRRFLQVLGLSSARAAFAKLFRTSSFLPFIPLRAKAESTPHTSFVLVGDFGAGYFLDGKKIPSQNPNSQAVADGIKKFAPIEGKAYIVSLGDQIYEPYDGSPSPEYPFNEETWPVSGMEAYDQTIGELYAPYILFPKGSKSAYAGKGSEKQRFLAILGDHDWWHQPRSKITDQFFYPINTATYPAQITPQPLYHLNDPDGQPIGYTEYFSNQGDGSGSGSCCYWDQLRGEVHWFALSSDPNEVLLGTLSNAYYSSTLPGGLLPDGLTPGEQNLRYSIQGKWFSKTARESHSPWKFVITHNPPYTSSSSENGMGGHPSATWMQWDYASLGIDAVFSGHVHNYERHYKDGVLYIVNGAGGNFKALAGFIAPPLSISRKRVGQVYGFLTAVEDRGKITFSYYTVQPQNSLPYAAQQYEAADSFTLLNNGTIKTLSEMEGPDSIVVTSGGGTLELNGFDLALNNKLQGVGKLTKKGDGALMMNGTNPDFSGILDLRRGSVRISAANALSENVLISARGGELIVEGVRQIFKTPLEIRGSLMIRLQGGGTLEFSESTSNSWSKNARLTIAGEVALRGIRFGRDACGLSSWQLSRIRLESDPALRFGSLDENGFLVESLGREAFLHRIQEAPALVPGIDPQGSSL